MKSIRKLIKEELDKFRDKPRISVKSLKDYKSIILQVKKSNPIKTSKIIEDWVNDHESELADMICGVGERYINCEHAAEIVGQILSDAEINHTLQVGIINGQSHSWAKINDIIIDPTKDQFPNIGKEDYNKNILWEKSFKFN
jgi:hypothetical protein